MTAAVVVDVETLRAVVADTVRAAVAPLVVAVGARPTPPAVDDLIDQPTLAELLRIDVRTLRRLVREGAVPAPIMIGGRIPRWRSAAVDAWLKSGAGAVVVPRRTRRGFPEKGISA